MYYCVDCSVTFGTEDEKVVHWDHNVIDMGGLSLPAPKTTIIPQISKIEETFIMPSPLAVIDADYTVHDDAENKNFDRFGDLVSRFHDAVDQLAEYVYEREPEIYILKLAIVAKEHALFYGPWGAGKNYLVENFAKLLNRSYFEHQISPGTLPENLTGSLDAEEFHATGKWKLNSYEMIQEAQVVFLDEVGTRTPMIQNFLKGIMEERKIKDGHRTVHMPLECMIGASNEVLDMEDRENGTPAFADRWLMRSVVHYLQGKDNRIAMLCDEDIQVDPIDPAIVDELQIAVNKITVTRDFATSAVDLYDRLRREIPGGSDKFTVSDRRFRKTIRKLARASAVLGGRTELRKRDLMVFAYTLWSDPNDQDILVQWLDQNVNKAMAKLDSLRKQVDEIMITYQQQKRTKQAIGSDSRSIIEMANQSVVQILMSSKMLTALKSEMEDAADKDEWNKLYLHIKGQHNFLMEESISLVVEDDSDMFEDLKV